jgi:signal transduction histidine kinase
MKASQQIGLPDQTQQEPEFLILKEKYRSIVENVGMGVALISPQMKILEMNSIIQQWHPDVIANGESYCYQSFNDEHLESPCNHCPTRKTLADGKVHELVKQVTLADGIHDFKIISSAIIDDQGNVIAALEMVNDITKELSMERELQQSQKLASIGQLAAGVAHEINNPTGFVSSNLGSLKGYQGDIDKLLDQYRELIETIRAQDPSLVPNQVANQIKKIEAYEEEIDLEYIREDVTDLISESKEGTDRIKKIVEDLKHFAHPGQDKIQDTDINKELSSTLNVVNNELKYKARVIKEFNDLPIIMANPQQLNQVFINILVNAAQSIENMGEIRILTQAADRFVQIHISDTGCGISEENLTRIFDPFFTTKGVGKGTGLGMNIAYNIIEKHQGNIQVNSHVGQGTTFVISLPVEGPVADTSDKAIGPDQTSNPESFPKHRTAAQV